MYDFIVIGLSDYYGIGKLNCFGEYIMLEEMVVWFLVCGIGIVLCFF